MHAVIQEKTLKEHPDAARALWRAGFPEDDDTFINAYFDLRSDLGRAAALFAKGEVLAGLHIIPQRMQVRGRPVQGACIAGVATVPAHRYHGYARALLDGALCTLREEHMPLAFLIPFKYSFYEKLGYRCAYALQQVVCAARDIPAPPEAARLGPPMQEDMRALYLRLMARYSGYVRRDARDWRWRMRDAALSGERGVVLYLQDQAQGYAFYQVKKGQLCVTEWAYQDVRAAQSLLGLLMAKTGALQCRYRVPSMEKLPVRGCVQQKRGAMVRAADIEALLGLVPAQGEGTLCLQVRDAQAPWNHDVFTLRARGGCVCVTRGGAPQGWIDQGALTVVLLGGGTPAQAARAGYAALAQDAARALAAWYPQVPACLFEAY
nr:GNAT family N-acetyltransferase [Maliibacterium massiliense]